MSKTLHSLFLAALLAAGLPLAAQGQSLGSKVEQLGRLDLVQVSQLMAARRDGLLQVQFELTNATAADQNVRYRLQWQDEAGLLVWDEEVWKPLKVHAGETKRLRIVAPTRLASDFRIQLHADDRAGGEARSSSLSNPDDVPFSPPGI